MPICEVCDKRGHGVQFPMLPKTDGYKFGKICADCDDLTYSKCHTGAHYTYDCHDRCLTPVRA